MTAFLESGYSLSHFTNFLHASLTFSMPCLAVLPRSFGGLRSHAYLIGLKGWIRLSLEKQSSFSHLATCCKYVEEYLQSLVTTNVFLGLQPFHFELSKKRTKATSHAYS